MRLFPKLQRAQLRLLEQQSGSWLRGNPWQCDFNLKSQISMPGTQAARALRVAVPPTSYAPASSDTRRRHHLQACYATTWALLLLAVHLLSIFLKIKGLTDDHINASAALGDEKCTNQLVGGCRAQSLGPSPLGAQVLSVSGVFGDPQGVGWIPDCWRVQLRGQPGNGPSLSRQGAGRGHVSGPYVHPGVRRGGGLLTRLLLCLLGAKTHSEQSPQPRSLRWPSTTWSQGTSKAQSAPLQLHTLPEAQTVK